MYLRALGASPGVSLCAAPGKLHGRQHCRRRADTLNFCHCSSSRYTHLTKPLVRSSSMERRALPNKTFDCSSGTTDPHMPSNGVISMQKDEQHDVRHCRFYSRSDCPYCIVGALHTRYQCAIDSGSSISSSSSVRWTRSSSNSRNSVSSFASCSCGKSSSKCLRRLCSQHCCW